MGITVRGLQALKPGVWLNDTGRNQGQLRAKGSTNGARFYFRYRRSDGTYDDLPIGRFHVSGMEGLSLEQAKARVKVLRDRYVAGDRDVRLAIEADQREAERQRNSANMIDAAEAARRRATLGALLTAYGAQLVRDKKASAPSVQQALQRHVEKPWPLFWNKPAEEVTSDDLLCVIAKLVDAGKLREAAKIRAYLRAAYAAAISARQDAKGLQALRDLRITVNPARDLVTIEGSSNARERSLSVAELRAYWVRIQAFPGSEGAAMRFHLLTGAQRIEQLARLTMTDVDQDSQTVRIRDKKGRRKVARIHDVPLIPAAVEAMQGMQGGTLGPFLFTLTAGRSGAVHDRFKRRVSMVVDAMAEAGELEKGRFTAGDLRRTVETRLSAAGVSEGVRGQVQSHCLGGVQSRHYDKHEYLNEKREALETLYRLLMGEKATVTRLRKRSGIRR